MTTLLEELSTIHENSFRLRESLTAALRKLEAGSVKNDRRQMMTFLTLAEGELKTAQQYLLSAVQGLEEETALLRSSSLATNRDQGPLTLTATAAAAAAAVPTISYFRFATGPLVTTAIIASPAGLKVNMLEDKTFSNLHQAFRERPFFPSPFGIQPSLITLMTSVDCSLYVDGNEPGGAATRSGFITGAIAAIASKLLEELDQGIVSKAVIIPKNSKYEDVTKICAAIVPPQVQVINLLGLVPRPQVLVDTQPRLIVCSISDIVNRAVIPGDCAHLVWDDFDGSDMVADYGFIALRDIVLRGPPRLAHTTMTPKRSTLRSRLYSFTRTANCFDVQPFSLARDVEALFKSLPKGKNVLFTTQTNAFIADVNIIASLGDLPFEADHLVVAEVPVSEDAIRAILREAFAKTVTFICQPTTPKALIHQAMIAEGLETPPQVSPAPSEVRTEPSPSIRY